MASSYNLFYDFNFNTVVNKLYSAEIKDIDTEIESAKAEMKTAKTGVALGPELTAKLQPYRDNITHLTTNKRNVVTKFISEYESIRAAIIFPNLPTKKEQTLLHIYINYINAEILPCVYKLLKINDDYTKSKFNILTELTPDNVNGLMENIIRENQTTPNPAFYDYDLINIFILHIKKLIYTMCVIYDRIFIKKEAGVHFVLLFCQGDYTTLLYKQGTAKNHEYLKKFIEGDMNSLILSYDAYKHLSNPIMHTPNAIELSYDIANTALAMFTSLDELSIFMDSIGHKIHRICILSCLNYDKYDYTYKKNNKSQIKVDSKNFIEYVDNIYIKPIIPLLTDTVCTGLQSQYNATASTLNFKPTSGERKFSVGGTGELFIYGGNAHNILKDRFKSVFEHVCDITANGGQLSIYKRTNKSAALNGGSRKYKTKRHTKYYSRKTKKCRTCKH